MNDDAVFWDRLQDMPHWEAEQECVSRREQLCLQKAMLDAEREKLLPLNSQKRKAEYKAIGIEQAAIAAQLTMLNEKIRYVRKLMDRLQWKDAVKALYGQEAFEECVVWLEREYGHITDKRREWAA